MNNPQRREIKFFLNYYKFFLFLRAHQGDSSVIYSYDRVGAKQLKSLAALVVMACCLHCGEFCL